MKYISVFLGIVLLASCSPFVYNLDIDVKKPAEIKYDLTGKDVAVFAIADYGDKDSLLVSELASGISERLEEDNDLPSGSIDVYSLFEDEVDFTQKSSIAYLSAMTESNLLLVVDSLKVFDFIVDDNNGRKVFYENGFYNRTNVFLPFSLHFCVYDPVTLKPLFNYSPNDSLMWSLMTDESISEVKAIAKANSTLKKVFKNMGEDIGAIFSPQWEEQERLLISYDYGKWEDAFELALDFKWEEARAIWMEKAKTENAKMAAIAAYNAALACEMLEQYDLAYQWLDFAAKRYNFSEIDQLRRQIKHSQKSNELINVKQ